MTLELSPDQAKALAAVEDWLAEGPEQVFTFFGPAGTGKTTIAKLLRKPGRMVHYGAFSGKAVNVLRNKGCTPAYTLHSLLYEPPRSRRAYIERLERELASIRDGRPEDVVFTREEVERIEWLTLAISDMGEAARRLGDLEWPTNPKSPLDETDLLVADEVSMVDEEMAWDMLSRGHKVLVLGDPEQLPPIKGGGFFTRRAPDVTLTESHRFYLDSQVGRIATAVRTGHGAPDDAFVRSTRNEYLEADQVLCWRRATRWDAVRYIRAQHGRPEGLPVQGDRIICLTNNRVMDLFNGQGFLVAGCDPIPGEEAVMLHLIDESDVYQRVISIPSHLAAFQGEPQEKAAERARLGSFQDDYALFTFSQALTVHKAQGSEWGRVLVLDETPMMFRMNADTKGPDTAELFTRRWLYTAVTRAQEHVSIIRRG